MSVDTQQKGWTLSDPKSALTIIEVFMLIGTLIWVFAIQSQQISQNKENIKTNTQTIQVQQDRTAQIEIKQAVTNEQYRQIIQRLDELKERLEDSQ